MLQLVEGLMEKHGLDNHIWVEKDYRVEMSNKQFMVTIVGADDWVSVGLTEHVNNESKDILGHMFYEDKNVAVKELDAMMTRLARDVTYIEVELDCVGKAVYTIRADSYEEATELAEQYFLEGIVKRELNVGEYNK